MIPLSSPEGLSKIPKGGNVRRKWESDGRMADDRPSRRNIHEDQRKDLYLY